MRSIHLGFFAVAMAALALGACGPNAPSTTGGSPDATEGPDAPAGGTSTACLSAADVSAAVGLEVQDFPMGTRSAGDSHVCAYQGSDAALGISVTTIVGPAAGSEQVYSDMREEAALFLGPGVEPERIEVGDGGYAYGSASKSVAAAVAGGRLYYAEVVSTASADIGDKQAGMVALVERLTAL